MPRQVAPPPSGEFQVVLSKPFSGTMNNEYDYEFPKLIWLF